ncbi:hypothetical protein [Microbacterium sp.]|uniref:hypothetical protein n=1 Tax=Microbacterium sp. TaxID=51671 RepID=UPI0039E33B82
MTTRSIGAGGLATGRARWALAFAWALGGVKALIDGHFTAEYPSLPIVCALCLIVVFVVTRRDDAPLSGALAAVSTAILIAATVLALLATPAAVSIWQLHFVAYLLALLFVRGNALAAAVGAATHLILVVAWMALTAATPFSFGQIMTPPAVAYIAVVVWVLVLRRIVLREQRLRSEAAEHERQIRAEQEAAEHIGRQLARVRTATEPALTQLRDGAVLDVELHRRIAVVEGALRDRLRSPRLQHPALDQAIAAARARGASVNVLAGDLDAAPALGDTAAAQLAGILHAAADADTIVIAWTETDRVSVVARSGERTTRHVVEVG